MDIKNLTEEQQQAFLDLAMLAMYADGQLTAVEDERIRRLLASMAGASDYDCNNLYDASVSRVRPYAETIAAARAHAASLAGKFTTREQRLQVLKIMDEFVTSDSHITLREGSLLSTVRDALRL